MEHICDFWTTKNSVQQVLINSLTSQTKVYDLGIEKSPVLSVPLIYINYNHEEESGKRECLGGVRWMPCYQKEGRTLTHCKEQAVLVCDPPLPFPPRPHQGSTLACHHKQRSLGWKERECSFLHGFMYSTWHFFIFKLLNSLGRCVYDISSHCLFVALSSQLMFCSIPLLPSLFISSL